MVGLEDSVEGGEVGAGFLGGALGFGLLIQLFVIELEFLLRGEGVGLRESAAGLGVFGAGAVGDPGGEGEEGFRRWDGC